MRAAAKSVKSATWMSALFATWELQPILKRIVKGLSIVPTKYRSVALPFYQILRTPHAVGHNHADNRRRALH